MTTVMVGQFQHQCRRCKKISGNGVSDKETCENTLFEIVLRGRSDTPQAPRLIEIHYCEDGGMGVADLIGCSVEEQPQ